MYPKLLVRSIAVICGVLFFMSAEVHAQSAEPRIVNSSGDINCPSCSKAIAGTYQFVVSSKKGVPVFSDNVLIEVEQVRDETETVILNLGPEARVIIPSRKEIDSPSFVPLEEIVYTN